MQKNAQDKFQVFVAYSYIYPIPVILKFLTC